MTYLIVLKIEKWAGIPPPDHGTSDFLCFVYKCTDMQINNILKGSKSRKFLVFLTSLILRFEVYVAYDTFHENFVKMVSQNLKALRVL